MRVVATAGHVDHGKSSLVRVLTGTDPDRFEEERRRGLTIDIGFAHAAVADGVTVSFIDVPGHVRFLRNMLAGVGGVSACLFVVAATEGWKPQSEEHLRILQLLGLSHGVVALTKVDLVDDEWRELQALDVRDHLAGTFLADAPIVAVSSTSGAGLDDLRAALAELVTSTPASADRGRPRLWIDRSFAAKGSGTVVTGTLTDGALTVDQLVDAGGRAVRIRGIQTLGRSVERIDPGQRTALNLVGVDHHDLARGDAVVVAGQWHRTQRVDAELHVLPTLGHVVGRRGAYAAYIGAGEWPVRLRVLGSESLPPGGRGAVRLHLPAGLPLLPGDRFVLRERGRDETVGGGEILDVDPVVPASRARPDRSIERVVRERGWVDVDLLDRLTGQRVRPDVGTWVVDPDLLAATRQRLVDQVTEAGPRGIELAALDARERATLEALAAGPDPTVAIDAGRATPVGTVDPMADHPVLALLADGGLAPPEPAGVPRSDLRELQRRGLLVERDGIWFHISAIDQAARAAARLLASRPDGFTLAELRDAMGVTRKYAVPLAGELDARGVTRRRGDLRIAGPRCPAVE